MDKRTIRLLVRRIAMLSVGRSTLRGQGAKGVVSKSREYLSRMRLEDFSGLDTRGEFIHMLNKKTNQLKRGFPGGAQNWGAARKAINIFLREVIYNKHASRYYQLANIEKWLEVPLDSHVAKSIRNTTYGNSLPRWETIKGLTAEVSEEYQAAAQKVANHLGMNRIDLDIYLWRHFGDKYLKHV